MKYSYFCNNCGFSFMSDDKNEMQKAGRDHRKISILGILKKDEQRSCPLVPIGDGTMARQSLADIINQRRVEE